MKNLSTKELNYINDFLSWELLSAKKCYQYGFQEMNSAHKQIFFDAANIHQQNYLNVLNYIDQVNKNQGGQAH
ncbi:MAG: hypothetical protein N2645_07505 [Clostridia bacterium]|nr:hypothetical protein [Clostridia bacterium]